MTHSDGKKPNRSISRNSSSFITGRAVDRYFELNSLLFEFNKLFSYEEENERSIAIVAATFLETLLEHILWAFLVDDEKEVENLLRYDQPLGTFSGKIRMVYCIGLIPRPIRNDLDYVRKIRNKFAHTLNVSFEDQQIRDWCRNLEWHQIAYMADPPSDATAQQLFQVGVNRLITYLNGVVSIARNEKREVIRYS